jgi:hypothetical protein
MREEEYYFNTSEINNPSPEWDAITQKAKDAFDKYKKLGKQGWLVFDRYYLTEGYWILRYPANGYAIRVIEHFNPKK